MPYKAKEILKALKGLGFEELRQSGSHLILKHPDGRRTIIPMHTDTIGKGLFKQILKQSNIDLQTFRKYL